MKFVHLHSNTKTIMKTLQQRMLFLLLSLLPLDAHAWDWEWTDTWNEAIAICDECGLCESCAVYEEHRPECGYCFGDEVQWCADEGEHCVNCCRDNGWICPACERCVEAIVIDTILGQ